MFDMFAEAIENLYTGMVENYVRKTPALREECAQRLSTGEMYLVDPNPHAPVPTEPTEENICLDIHNNLKFSPRLCLWAIDQKLAQTNENLIADTCANFVIKS